MTMRQYPRTGVRVSGLITLLLGAASFGCAEWQTLPLPWDGLDDAFTPIVCMQVTESSDPEAFDRVMSEVETRGIKCVVLVTADIAEQRCAALAGLAGKGYEIMAFTRPVSSTGESMTMSMLTYEEQEALISEVATAIENCLGAPPSGFRCTQFDQNEDTWAIVDAMGFDYNLGFVAGTGHCLPGHQYDILPYQASAYSFWAVPMHAVYHGGRWAAFCDNPFRSVEATEWEALLKSEFDRMASLEQPLLVEFHPYTTGTDEGRFAAFVSFLDHAQARGARFVTVAELVAWSQGAAPSGCGCDE